MMVNENFSQEWRARKARQHLAARPLMKVDGDVAQEASLPLIDPNLQRSSQIRPARPFAAAVKASLWLIFALITNAVLVVVFATALLIFPVVIAVRGRVAAADWGLRMLNATMIRLGEIERWLCRYPFYNQLIKRR